MIYKKSILKDVSCDALSGASLLLASRDHLMSFNTTVGGEYRFCSMLIGWLNLFEACVNTRGPLP